MSSSVSIRHLTKKYRIATRRPGFGMGAVGGAVSRLRGSAGSQTLLALDDVSFDVVQGEVVGLVGRNGAGKSTLLKILSRIVEPDGGEVLLHGRVGSLLEVGTGFHPELTGRENIFLNGAILGMRRAAIARAFDSIVDFAGTEQFLDTPVKRYSSGMYVRLAFAVAAHLDTEILLIDEVLAVGDAAFQAKCLAKIGDVSSSEGRTVLFVSHNMAAIETLCTRAVYVAAGRVVEDGPAPAVVRRYHGDLFATATAGAAGSFDLSARANAFDADQPVVINALRLEDAAGQPTNGIQGGEELVVEVDLCHLHSVKSPVVAVMVNDHAGRILATMSTRMTGSELSLTAAGSEVTMRLRAFELALAPGDYWLTVGVKDATHDRKVDAAERIGPLHVAAGNFFGTGYLPSSKDGVMLVRHEWSVETG